MALFKRLSHKTGEFMAKNKYLLKEKSSSSQLRNYGTK